MRLVRVISQIESQRNMVGFAMEGHMFVLAAIFFRDIPTYKVLSYSIIHGEKASGSSQYVNLVSIETAN